MTAVITVATTGPIASKADNPHLPTQPEEIAEEVFRAYEAGASIAHIHVRDENDLPTADLSVARRTMDLISERCPILIQLSTGVGLSVPFEDRQALVDLQPKMATLNPCSMSFGAGEFRNAPADVARLASKMLDLGIKPELEIYDTGHLDACFRLRDQGLLGDGKLQFSLVLGVAGGMAATAENLMTMVKRLPEDAVWQVIAIGRNNLELTSIGLAMGGNARAGLEDTLYLRKGELSPGIGRSSSAPSASPRLWTDRSRRWRKPRLSSASSTNTKTPEQGVPDATAWASWRHLQALPVARFGVVQKGAEPHPNPPKQLRQEVQTERT